MIRRYLIDIYTMPLCPRYMIDNRVKSHQSSSTLDKLFVYHSLEQSPSDFLSHFHCICGQHLIANKQHLTQATFFLLTQEAYSYSSTVFALSHLKVHLPTLGSCT